MAGVLIDNGSRPCRQGVAGDARETVWRGEERRRPASMARIRARPLESELYNKADPGTVDDYAHHLRKVWSYCRCRLCGDANANANANANADGYRLFGELIHKDNIESYLMLPEMFYFRL
ncbi:hypothetical protein [Xanthomonas campestris]|uniref:hypothetical protein n=1 Tax=Xanthomonas campestris TaxID=339 RepID=UPI0013ED4666|nr:hypothetical protein [Xanthomonas campestris]